MNTRSLSKPPPLKKVKITTPEQPKLKDQWSLLAKGEIFNLQKFSERKILRNLVNNDIKRLRDPHQFVELFISDDIFKKIVQYTNANTHSINSKNPPNKILMKRLESMSRNLRLKLFWG